MFQSCKMCRLTILIFTLLSGLTLAIPAKRSSLLLDDSSIHTEAVGQNNKHELFAKFNLTEAEVSRIFAGMNAANKEAEADGRTSQYFNNIREFRINDIRNRISNAIQNVHSEENQEHPLHEMAAYPICNSETSESSWLQDNNVTIQFAQSLFEQSKGLNLDSAILRLFKVNPNSTMQQRNADAAKNVGSSTDDNTKNAEEETDESGGIKLKRCVKPNMDPQIRVTVSLVQQLRRNKRGVYERKKRICNTVMMNVTQTGWVEIDIKRAIYIWEETAKQLQQTQSPRSPVLVGWLMIEVHDEEELPLKPGLFFNPPHCNQADIAIPWNYYRPDTAMPSFATHEVPRYPRLDVKMIGYASFAPIHQRHTEQDDKLYANLKRQVFNMTHEIRDSESTTYIAPTADNHLDANDNTASIVEEKEMQQQEQEQREHFQHKRHLKLEQLKEQLAEVEEKSDREEQEMKEYRQHNHHHHRHHRRREQHKTGDDDENQQQSGDHQPHHHHHHGHTSVRNSYDDSSEGTDNGEIEQQQYNDKLLQHIAHKLLQEEKQLHLLHQQQQQFSTDAYNI